MSDTIALGLEKHSPSSSRAEPFRAICIYAIVIDLKWTMSNAAPPLAPDGVSIERQMTEEKIKETIP